MDHIQKHRCTPSIEGDILEHTITIVANKKKRTSRSECCVMGKRNRVNARVAPSKCSRLPPLALKRGLAVNCLFIYFGHSCQVFCYLSIVGES